MSNFYEDTLLRVEFELVQKLQKDSEFLKYVTVKYEDRITGEEKTVSTMPVSIYPEIYVVEYQMPVYVSEGRLRNDYKATAKITLSEPVLNDRQANNGPLTIWKSNFVPFNKHLSGTTVVCSGNAWSVAKNLGLWHYIISLGALVNQDIYVCDESAEGHYNSEANQYWISRGKKPITDIKWPFDLVSRAEITIVPKIKTEKIKMTIVKKASEQPIKKMMIIRKLP